MLNYAKGIDNRVLLYYNEYTKRKVGKHTMKELMKMAIALTAMEVECALCSKVEGRRNWFIRVETRTNAEGMRKRVITYHGGFGYGRNKGFTRCSMRDISEKRICWYEYTYKKDYLTALAALKTADVCNLWNDQI